MAKEIQHWVFDTMRISNADERIMDAIIDRNDPLTCTPQQDAAVERFIAEYQRAHQLVSSGFAGQG